jgi:hypothetical protein
MAQISRMTPRCTFTQHSHTNQESKMVLSRWSKTKWCSTAVTNFTPKELGESYATHSEVSKMLMKSVFLAVSVRLPQLLGGENAVAFEDTREGEEKKDLVEGAVTGLPHCQCMSCQDTLDSLILIGHHPLSRQKDPHPSPLSTFLMRPCCTAVACKTHCVFNWPAGTQISIWPVILAHKIHRGTGVRAKDAQTWLQFLANFCPSKLRSSDAANYFEKS